MKRVMATISAILLCATMLIACGDPVEKDLINYVNNQIPPLVEMQGKIAEDFTAIIEDKKATSETYVAKIKDTILPKCDELITKTKAIAPETEEVRKLNSKYIAVVTEQREGFNLFIQAFQKK